MRFVLEVSREKIRFPGSKVRGIYSALGNRGPNFA